MGLITCPDCSASVSGLAPACIHCGRPLEGVRNEPPPLPSGLGQMRVAAAEDPQVVSPDMSFGDAIAICFRNYAVFSGRARRAEYWWFFLFNCLLSIGASMIDMSLSSDRYGDDQWGTGPVAILVAVATFLPGTAVSVRRLHDTARSGWWLLGLLLMLPVGLFVMAIAIAASQQMDSPGAILVVAGLLLLAVLAGAVTLVVWYATDGTAGSNRYGPDPKGRSAVGSSR